MQNLFKCCFGSASEASYSPSDSLTIEKTRLLADSSYGVYMPEKPLMYRRPKGDVAADIIKELYSSTSTSSTSALEEIVREAGWWNEAIAKAVLAALKRALTTSKIMGSAIEQAYNRAVAEAKKIKEIADEHPVLEGVFLTVVALGILYLMWPNLLLALGFGEEGIVLGSWAARWQSLYPDVPVGSVFAFLQRLGMTLKPALSIRL